MLIIFMPVEGHPIECQTLIPSTSSDAIQNCKHGIANPICSQSTTVQEMFGAFVAALSRVFSTGDDQCRSYIKAPSDPSSSVDTTHLAAVIIVTRTEHCAHHNLDSAPTRFSPPSYKLLSGHPSDMWIYNIINLVNIQLYGLMSTWVMLVVQLSKGWSSKAVSYQSNFDIWQSVASFAKFLHVDLPPALMDCDLGL
ncbi:hypothetical protein STEG23_022218 [Scotinomys teguina]